MKSGAQFKDRRNAPINLNSADGLVQGAGNNLKQRALAGTVPAYNAHDLAALNLERHVAQRPTRFVPGASGHQFGN